MLRRMSVSLLLLLGMGLFAIAMQSIQQSGLFLAGLAALLLAFNLRRFNRYMQVILLILLAVFAYLSPAITHPKWFSAPAIGIFIWVGWQFAQTLRPQHLPLIQRFMLIEGRTITPYLAQYARKLTQYWAGMMWGQALLGVYLVAYYPRLRSVFAHGLSPMLMLLLLWGEHIYRMRCFPAPHSSFLHFLGSMPRLWQAAKQFNSTP